MNYKTNYPQGECAPKNTTNRKNKASLLLGLGLGVAVMVAGLSSCGGGNKGNDADTQAYKACSSVADYRAYMKNYGANGKFYKEAKNVVERYMADSAVKAEKAFAKEQAQERAEARAEAERKEDASYKNCTTVAACDAYLRAYPQGRYVDEVKAKKRELERKEAEQAQKKEDELYRNCTTIAGCDAYLRAYPQGKYVTEVKKKKAELEKKGNSQPNKVKPQKKVVKVKK